MGSLRIASVNAGPTTQPCCRCSADEQNWDRIAGKAYCPECEETMAQGEGPPVIERTEKNCCAACGSMGTVRFLTFPLRSTVPIEIDLCPLHLRLMLARNLDRDAFEALRQQLGKFNVAADEIFLMHRAFYDRAGRALKPAVEAD